MAVASQRILRDCLDWVNARASQDLQKLSTAENSWDPPAIEQPKMVTGCTVRPFQLEGVGFLIDRYLRNVGCILADEMGLGKTLQTITYIAHLREKKITAGPFLVVCPLSMLDSWLSEFNRFVGSNLSVRSLAGDKETRELAIRAMKRDTKRLLEEQKHQQQQVRSASTFAPFSRSFCCDVVVTTYDNVLAEIEFLSRVRWTATIVDEAHRLKNADSVLSRTMLGEMKLGRVVLLTGTPAQNNMVELWSLLRFIIPDFFKEGSMKDFTEAFKLVQHAPTPSSPSSYNVDAVTASAVSVTLQRLLSLFMLRRTKARVGLRLPPKHETIVYCGMSEMQKKYYRAVLTKNALALGSASASCVNSVLSSLRKCVNHPYLFPGAEPEPFEEGEHIWENSNKLAFLHALLPVLKARGRRVLMFSTSTATLDIIQDYLSYMYGQYFSN